MLGLVGNAGPAASVVEEAVYDPGLQQSGDLESGTRAVTATTMGGAADYTTALTVPAPADAALACGVGSCATASPGLLPALCIQHRGLAHVRFVPLHAGTGVPVVTLNDPGFTGGATPMYAQAVGDWSRGEKLALVVDPVFACNGTVATDINVLNWVRATLWAPGD